MAYPPNLFFTGMAVGNNVSYQVGVQMVPPAWAISNQAAAGATASISRASLAGGCHVCTGLSASVVATTALAGGEVAILNLRDGATGAGTVLWTWEIGLPGAAAIGTTQVVGPVAGLFIIGSQSTAMTLEFAGSMANAVQSVSLCGFDLF